MRTTVELPDALFREVKTRAVQQGVTLKGLMTRYIQAGLRGQSDQVPPHTPIRRPPPPVAIRRVPGQSPVSAQTNRQLNALLDDEEVSQASRAGQPSSPHNA